MAIRNILRDGDEALHKRCRPVEEYNERLWQLLDDMAETMRAAEGAGLAAPQVGILRRVFVMDVGNGLIEAVNPEIIAVKGTQEDVEGCLSFPGEYGITRRPKTVKFKARDRHGKYFIKTVEDLEARCVCHETDHLDGIVFKTHVIRYLDQDGI